MRHIVSNPWDIMVLLFRIFVVICLTTNHAIHRECMTTLGSYLQIKVIDDLNTSVIFSQS